MLNLNVEDLMVEFDEGSIKNVGPTTKSASAKLFHPESAEAREFGDSQVKVVAEDESGNEVQIAMGPDEAEVVLEDLQALREESRVFE